MCLIYFLTVPLLQSDHDCSFNLTKTGITTPPPHFIKVYTDILSCKSRLFELQFPIKTSVKYFSLIQQVQKLSENTLKIPPYYSSCLSEPPLPSMESQQAEAAVYQTANSPAGISWATLMESGDTQRRAPCRHGNRLRRRRRVPGLAYPSLAEGGAVLFCGGPGAGTSTSTLVHT